MNLYKFFEKNKDNEIYGYIYYVYSPDYLNNVKYSLLKLFPNIIDYDNINIVNNIYELKPKSNFKTTWNTNVICILNKCDIYNIYSIEKSILYKKEVKYDNLLYTLNNYNANVDAKDNTNVKNNMKQPKYIEHFEIFNDNNNLGIDNSILSEYSSDRLFTDVELYDISQSNSEHCRHWLFNADLYISNLDYLYKVKSLFELIKEPYYNVKNINNNNSTIIAFKDNASALKGYNVNKLYKSENNKINNQNILQHFTLKCETHNFPSAICPFPAAETGVGGRIRDTICIGRGGMNIAGIAGYCVGNLNNYNLEWEDGKYKEGLLLQADNILIETSNGASDYGNKIGEPIIQGFTRSFGMDILDERYEWLKPIMFSGGIGFMYDNHKNKVIAEPGMKIVKIGGKAYKIGLGGSTSSSSTNNNEDVNKYQESVQRGDAMMENKVSRVVRECINLLESNPILSIHDQGAGGMSNVVKELIEPYGADIYLDRVDISDNNLSSLEIWCCEYQEVIYVLIKDNANFDILKSICEKENVSCIEIGVVRKDTKLKVYDNRNKYITNVVNYDTNINKVTKSYNLVSNIINTLPVKLNKRSNSDYIELYNNYNIFNNHLKKVLSLLAVGSKRFLTNKVDRSVTGLIAQQQCIGYLQTPLSNYSIVASSYYDNNGIATSVGEKPINALINPRWSVRMAIGESLTNLIFVLISSFDSIRLAGNWMWPAETNEEKYHLYNAVESVSELLLELGICIDGGKDSVSMSTKIDDTIIKSPRTFVATSYCSVPNIIKKITPEFKSMTSTLLFVDLGYGNMRLGGSAYYQVNNQLGNNTPNFENPKKFIKIFNLIQDFIMNNNILSGHDRSDGGLINTICEMTIASNIGCNIYLNDNKIVNDNNYLDFLFNEELGLVLEVDNNNLNYVLDSLNELVSTRVIGVTTNNDNINIQIYNDEIVLYKNIKDIRKLWEYISYQLEIKQIGKSYADKELDYLLNTKKNELDFYYTKNIINKLLEIETNLLLYKSDDIKYNVGIIRDEGSNGDREMEAAFHLAGFNVYNISINDMLNNNNLLNDLNGIVFVGGFSYADALGSANGWYNVIENNISIKEQFDNFYKKDYTFSLGVCNGFQLMSKLGWLDVEFDLIRNDSKRFESRFVNVKIEKTNNIFLKNMEGLKMGIWIAHGEGKLVSNNINEINEVSVIRYCDNNYPMNPNGSIDNITGISSKNGRHLGMMPHPERCVMNWQLPYISDNIPDEIKNNKYTPWYLIFKNVYDWCKHN